MADDPFKDLEGAFAAQKAHSDKVKASVDELRQVSVQGKSSAKAVTFAMGGLGMLVFLVLSAVMLATPGARTAYFFLMPCVLVAGVWSYYRKQSG